MKSANGFALKEFAMNLAPDFFLTQLYISGLAGVGVESKLKRLGITHVLNCAEEAIPEATFPGSFIYKTLGLRVRILLWSVCFVPDPALS